MPERGKFDWILEEIAGAGYLSPGAVFAEDEAPSDLPPTPQEKKQDDTSKRKYVYEEYYDFVICPEYRVLKYSATNREGHREY